MNSELNPTRAFWLGHLYCTSAQNMPLSDYAASQALALDDLLAWERRLSVQGLPVPPCCRPARFVAVEVAT
ncbi:hypothetical protein J7J47_11005 [Halomonas sp. ISL-60]|uniref:hypothetical protein n=1 Tax=Halomonas sp. ISL-56 TaxID=2819149 RepID=UPI001BEB08E1|nr:hypothetical protein [Halomonas sp. ISL-56]MBT2772754.1 hypothetical protein [Halomonas sp. ISL-60]MBT2800549.1 hypothetical protein [Halomonas sp. ISL-56]